MFFYVEEAAGLFFSVSPEILSFSQTNQTKQATFSATGLGTENFTIESDNNLFTVSVTNGSIYEGVLLPVNITFTGSDNNQFAIITLTGDSGNSVSVQVNSSMWTNAIGVGGGGGGGMVGPGPLI